MKKFISVVAIFMIVVTLLALTACSTKDKMIGTWVCESSISGYPDIMTLSSDGTGVMDSISVSWYIDEANGKFVFITSGLKARTHTLNYAISGDKLYLDSYAYNKL